ncbi:MAG TPA: hypothetical protein PLI05_07320 [Methanotrichaceae archaeon]|nr:hypothetical protein [Methanotrichaceae archaeon]HQF16859.1 hypothetical protein [Methanotrichaceae archaeon]HQI91425.1 hypothetical protein [Methanotrichaceae archaeon]HQJ28796.1 hypothetical protein [Methanotrichaceae archaeon]
MSRSWSRGEGWAQLPREQVADMWHERFGTPEDLFIGLGLFRRGRMVWAFSQSQIPPFCCETVGLRIMSLRDPPWKPTTYALQMWGHLATRNVIRLDRQSAMAFFAGQTQSVDQTAVEAPLESGYVVVCHGEDVLGCGLYSQGRLICQLPKERRILGDDEDSSGGDR